MGSHPINLAFRFVLEIAGLVALAWMGWQCSKGAYRYLYAIGFPVIAAGIWGVFAVPDDPSRSGNAIIAIPGVLRLMLELGFFASATLSLFVVGATSLGWIYAAAVFIHYIASYERVRWLIQQ